MACLWEMPSSRSLFRRRCKSMEVVVRFERNELCS
jgi:hypothetical protein